MGHNLHRLNFQNFLCQHHIIHHKSPPYHPATNGLAENMVKSVKTHLRKHKPVRATNIHRSISEFLITYRCHRDACFLGYRVSCTHIPRDACFPAHISLMHLCSTSHSDICFPGYFVSPPPLRRFTT